MTEHAKTFLTQFIDTKVESEGVAKPMNVGEYQSACETYKY